MKKSPIIVTGDFYFRDFAPKFASELDATYVRLYGRPRDELR